MGKIIKQGPYQKPAIYRPDLVECTVATGVYRPGDQIYYKWEQLPANKWKLVTKKCRKQTVEDLDGWATDKIIFNKKPGLYLLQAKVSFEIFTKGDRIWWDRPAHKMLADSDKGKWITVRQYDKDLDG